MGHNWDTEYNAGAWEQVSGWIRFNVFGDDDYEQGLDASGVWWHLKSAQFVSNYAETNPNEDFAESFAAFFMDRAGFSSGYATVAAKNTFMQNMVDSM
jgi:hypothetical protein